MGIFIHFFTNIIIGILCLRVELDKYLPACTEGSLFWGLNAVYDRHVLSPGSYSFKIAVLVVDCRGQSLVFFSKTY